MHRPVLVKEVLAYLALRRGQFVIDGTIDGGGHAREMLKCIGPTGKLLGIDWDEKMIEQLKEKMSKEKNLLLIHGNYTDTRSILEKNNLDKADAFLLDLGFSSDQLISGRGFSFSPAAAGEPLLMTYRAKGTPVKELLRKIREEELVKILYELGGERYAKKIAHAIMGAERRKKIETSGELREVIERAVPRGYERGRIHPATRTFQALRIYVNHELENLALILRDLKNIVKKDGRVAIISFHSLEDRIVKNAFQNLEKDHTVNILTQKPIRPSRDEIALNPRSRSAKLRVAQIVS